MKRLGPQLSNSEWSIPTYMPISKLLDHKELVLKHDLYFGGLRLASRLTTDGLRGTWLLKSISTHTCSQSSKWVVSMVLMVVVPIKTCGGIGNGEAHGFESRGRWASYCGGGNDNNIQ